MLLQHILKQVNAVLFIIYYYSSYHAMNLKLNFKGDPVSCRSLQANIFLKHCSIVSTFFLSSPHIHSLCNRRRKYFQAQVPAILQKKLHNSMVSPWEK
jgi:hypothetical protein